MSATPVIKGGILAGLASALLLGFSGSARACDDPCYRPTYRKPCYSYSYRKACYRPKVVVIYVKRPTCYKPPVKNDDYQDQQPNYNKKDQYKKNNYKNNNDYQDQQKQDRQYDYQKKPTKVAPRSDYQKKPTRVAPRSDYQKKPRVAPKPPMKRVQEDDDRQLID